MITSQCGKLPCVQRTGSLPQRHYFSILRPRCKGAGRISGKVLAMLGRFCPRFPPSPRRFVKIVGNRPARRVLGPGGAGAQPAVPGCAGRLPCVAAGAWRQRINASLSSGPPAGRCKHRPLRRGGGAPRPSSPAMPDAPGPAARLPCIVGRAFTPAGEACGGPEGYSQGKMLHPSVGWRRQLPLQGSLPGGGSPQKASPARGCGLERRLRRRKRDGAGLTVAERKCASARAVRCGHRKPDGGCAVRRRRRGALPLCPTGILQNPAGPCPRIRRGRCWHHPGNLAMPQTPSGGRNRPPYIAALNGH